MHVLWVGRGNYPWPKDGTEYDFGAHEDNAMGMGQLATSPVSMRLLADWFLNRFGNHQ